MKVVLINPPSTNEILGNNPSIIESSRGCNPPLGILFLAGCQNKNPYLGYQGQQQYPQGQAQQPRAQAPIGGGCGIAAPVDAPAPELGNAEVPL